MGSMDGYLQALSLVAILILAPMTIHLMVHQEENTVFVFVEPETEPEDEEEVVGREIPQLNRSEVARIATFNIKVFGKTKMGKPDVVTQLVDTVLQYDLVAIQEIKDIDETVPYNFLAELNNASGNFWNMSLSVRSGTQADDQSSQEQYAYYYNHSVFREIGEGELYNDSANDYFQREPYRAQFELLNASGNSSGFDFTLFTIHTKPASALAEIDALHEVIQSYQENDTTETDVILLGDLNADCSYATAQELWESPLRQPQYNWLVNDIADTTVSSTDCAYDRIITLDDLNGRLVGSWGIDTSITNTSVSDHYPVWFDLYR
ncbi:MAG: endonuclease/exonuclease/phosphatase family protein [Candidatus Poseidoniaceae archaeon]|nr:endonuclease/exonuclease/phosphatase family protein [Candidatus Poseidoniaceae archaeon]